VVTVSRSSLWLGKDHLLVIENNGYTESYKRFFFRDIQGIIIWETAHWKVRGLILGVIAGLFGLPTVLGDDPITRWVFGILSGICLLFLSLDLVAGPTCRCRFRSAVQIEEMPSLNRLRRANKVLEQIRPLIIASQGALTPGQIAAQLEPALVENIPNPTSTPSTEPGL
jgi:hypothetical protein